MKTVPADTELDDSVIARRLAAIGSVPRLRLLRALLQAAPDGLTVRQIQSATGMAASTQFHHLSQLQQAGLVSRHPCGKEVVNRADLQALGQIARALLQACCQGKAAADAFPGGAAGSPR